MNPSKFSILLFSSAFVLSSCSNHAKPTEQKKCNPKAQKQTFPVKTFQETYVHDRWGNPIYAKPKYLVDGTNSGVYFSGCESKEQKIKKGKQKNTNGSKGFTSEKSLSSKLTTPTVVKKTGKKAGFKMSAENLLKLEKAKVRHKKIADNIIREGRERKEQISRNIEEGISIGGQKGLIYILNKRTNIKLKNPSYLGIFDLKLRKKGINYLENIYIANKDLLLVGVNTEYNSGVEIFGFDVTGTSTTTAYISAIQKGGLLYKTSGEKYRGLISLTDITETPKVIKTNEAEEKEIAGSLKAELKNNSIQNILIHINEYNENISPVKYTLVKSTQSKTIADSDLTDTISDAIDVTADVIGMVVDYAEENPISTAAVAYGVYWYTTSDSVPAYSNNSNYSPSTSNSYLSKSNPKTSQEKKKEVVDKKENKKVTSKNKSQGVVMEILYEKEGAKAIVQCKTSSGKIKKLRVGYHNKNRNTCVHPASMGLSLQYKCDYIIKEVVKRCGKM